MKTHDMGQYPRNFRYFDGVLHLMLTDFVKGLVFDQEDYSPILQTFTGGHLKYMKVTPYDQKWLPLDAQRRPIPENKRVSFEPASVSLSTNRFYSVSV